MHVLHSQTSSVVEGMVKDVEDAKDVKDLSSTTTVPAERPTRWTRRRIIFFAGLAFLVSVLVALIVALPIVLRRQHRGFQSPIPNDSGIADDPTNLGNGGPLRPSDLAQPLLAVNNFPDPGLLEYNGTWYAFGTNQKGQKRVHIPIATSKDFIHWTLMGEDALPVVGPWELEINHWAPDVIRRVS